MARLQFFMAHVQFLWLIAILLRSFAIRNFLKFQIFAAEFIENCQKLGTKAKKESLSGCCPRLSRCCPPLGEYCPRLSGCCPRSKDVALTFIVSNFEFFKMNFPRESTLSSDVVSSTGPPRAERAERTNAKPRETRRNAAERREERKGNKICSNKRFQSRQAP